MRPRLTADFWVKAHIRRLAGRDIPAMLVRRGDATAGAVLIKINLLDGRARVLSSATGLDGNRLWLSATGPEPVPEPEADAYIGRQIGRDPDLWVVEVEDREGRHLLDDPVDPPDPFG